MVKGGVFILEVKGKSPRASSGLIEVSVNEGAAAHPLVDAC